MEISGISYVWNIFKIGLGFFKICLLNISMMVNFAKKSSRLSSSNKNRNKNQQNLFSQGKRGCDFYKKLCNILYDPWEGYNKDVTGKYYTALVMWKNGT